MTVPATLNSTCLRIWICAVCLVVVAGFTYRNCYQVPFLFDDVPTIQDNPGIRHLRPLAEVLLPPGNSGVTTAGRPLVNLSLALNYALGQSDVWGYHIFNVTIHIFSGLILFGATRRTLLQSVLYQRFGKDSLSLALAIATLWCVHPLCTEAVTYIVQRAESLAALFTLLTLYSFIRGSSGGRAGWYVISVVSCFLGVASKEVGSMAPLVVILYDRAFVAGDFRKAFSSRWPYYLALGTAWLLQVALILSTGNRGGTTGFGSWMPWWKYALTQSWAICNYLKLTFWPHPLILDYGVELVSDPLQLTVSMAVVLALLAGTVRGLMRNTPAGYCGAWFFIILAPSSSILPVITQTMAEHRMYLPLVAVMALLVLGMYRWKPGFAWAAVVPLIIGACILTQMRNVDYQSPLSIWTDTAKKFPENARAWRSIGSVLASQGNNEAAMKYFQQSLALQPNDSATQNAMGMALTELHNYPEAAKHLMQAVEIRPTNVEALNNLGGLLVEGKHYPEAIDVLMKAIALAPHQPQARYNWGKVLYEEGKTEEARMRFNEVLAMDPGFQPARIALDVLNQPGADTPPPLGPTSTPPDASR